MKNPCRGAHRAKWILTVLLVPSSLVAEPVSLKRIVELALVHATGSAIAAADEQRAAAGYRELRNNYIPQLSTGAGIGYSYGFPLGLEGSAPSLFNLNTQSVLFNPGLSGFLKAAQIESTVASLKKKDERNQIIQDAVLSYADLAKWEQRLSRLQETEAEAGKMQTAVAERVKEGVDSELDGTRARLSVARIHERVVEAQGSADVLREHLSKLTGLPAADIQTEPDGLPGFPALPQDDSVSTRATDANPSVQAAVEHARAQYLRAQGEHRAFWPSFDFAAQYALLSTFNNFQNYYIPEKPCTVSLGTFLCPTGSFHQNNATIGVSIRFPFFSAAQRARAQAADADALKASKQAEAAKNQVSEETLRWQRSVAQMQAARDVAELEYEIAQKSLAAVHTRMGAGTANLHDLDDARSQASERFIALQDVTFQLQRAQLGLLRSTGDLEKWALETP
ncbi:Outer membrane efflux protein [Candidatus Sulfotelmatobacter kueseliae]|uniref:Outer membrane efflux protein n=1 Tax=Candidatus Sulfotelmatobacter kueseliae TaxID=2042962 RepID=A0A2U3L2F7_9BACT|nr:Outer membrane efflux protein [Candidatus Sulfotelmatobacter kueseliae]